MHTLTIALPPEVLDEIAGRVVEVLADRLEYRPCSDLMTPAEAAEYLHCKPQRIYDLRSRGDLPSFKEGGRVLIRRADLDALLVEV